MLERLEQSFKESKVKKKEFKRKRILRTLGTLGKKLSNMTKRAHVGLSYEEKFMTSQTLLINILVATSSLMGLGEIVHQTGKVIILLKWLKKVPMINSGLEW